MDAPRIKVLDISFAHLWVGTRFPFRYGIASMTRAPHVLVQATVECDGRVVRGVSAETWVPKWFVKNPDTSYDEDLPDMCRTLQHAADAAMGPEEALSFFHWWREVYAAQSDLAGTPGIPPLLAHLGTAMVERAVCHALCQARKCSIHTLWRENLAGIDFAGIRRETAGLVPADVIPAAPAERLIVRHTVGLADPLTDSDIAAPLNDGLPHSLEENIRAFGLTHFKIKLAGNRESDTARLDALAFLLPAGAKFTLDGNENYPDIRVFREHWNHWMTRPHLAAWLEQGLLLVEQPLHRDSSLQASTGEALESWAKHPPFIIDEADASLNDLPRALALGYAGTSHKNCKGLTKGLANRALLHRHGLGSILSGEDLSNIGPVALLQDLAVMAALGIPHIERNGHHYFRGTGMFPAETGRSLLTAHPLTWMQMPDGTVALRIVEGAIQAGSIAGAPMGLTGGEVIAGFVPGLPVAGSG
ncbi:MAG TPA: enolase C-terminal domain-like protein, partial [Verrucomicrobiales bacterium]|nr:enolase C-terminal domain-like protein [Verrucomicrobiales bacterium]